MDVSGLALLFAGPPKGVEVEEEGVWCVAGWGAAFYSSIVMKVPSGWDSFAFSALPPGEILWGGFSDCHRAVWGGFLHSGTALGGSLGCKLSPGTAPTGD